MVPLFLFCLIYWFALPNRIEEEELDEDENCNSKCKTIQISTVPLFPLLEILITKGNFVLPCNVL